MKQSTDGRVTKRIFGDAVLTCPHVKPYHIHGNEAVTVFMCRSDSDALDYWLVLCGSCWEELQRQASDGIDRQPVNTEDA